MLICRKIENDQINYYFLQHRKICDENWINQDAELCAVGFVIITTAIGFCVVQRCNVYGFIADLYIEIIIQLIMQNSN